MKKKVFALMMVAVMTFLMAAPAFAASGLNSNEEELFSYWSTQVKSKTWLGSALTAQYLAEAENALLQVDLDKAACDDLKGAVDAVMAILNNNNVQSLSEAKAFHDQYLSAVNPIAGKYGMTVKLDAKTGVATVIVNGKPVGDTSKAVKQTGFEFAQTAAVCIALIAGVGAAFAVARKKGVLA